MSSTHSRGRRATFSLVVFTLVAVLLGAKLFQIQVVQAAELNEVSKDKRAVPVSIPSPRGDVVDRNNIILATTEERYDVQLSPKNTRVRDGVFYRFSETNNNEMVAVTAEEAYEEIGLVTGQSGAEIKQIVDEALAVDEKSDFAYVKRSIDLEQLNELKKLNIPWLSFDYNFQRIYPNGAVAGNLIGFSGYDETPLAGVELSQDQCLQGVDGYETYERGADGVALPGSNVIAKKAEAGGTVELTIDADLQWQSQQIVNERVAALGADWVRAVIMDVKTGELLAVAEDGSVDPGDIDSSEASKREARAYVDPYEPGSTFKTITTASLLDSGVATPHTPYETPWTYSPDPNVRFSDWFQHDYENWTLAGIMTFSSNVGTAMLGTQLDAQTRYDYMRKFGFGESTNTGMPLEDAGLLYKAEDWDLQTSYNVTFGQGLSSTIIQTAGAYQAIANAGVRIPPSLVKGCVGSDGVRSEIDHGEPIKVISERAAAETIAVLETAVEESWAKDVLNIPGYRVAGKTGTSEQPDGQGGYKEEYVHSFAGIFPADDPQYVIVSSIDSPAVYATGTAEAIKIVKDLAEITIRAMNVAPSEGAPKLYPLYY
ncbi:MAG TPA: penicillin-binding protein 2 [Microbacteriaceae bacterium]|nr:penicillin-binding protein 2 [Microbacteriaceae bacterium]